MGTTVRHYPYGGYRTAPTTGDITDRGFTGHRHNDGIGLIYMQARYYVPGVGRFASADTIVPDPADPQSHNRYAYVLNDPLRYSDPSGHYIFEDDPSQPYLPPPPQIAADSRILELWEMHALMQAVFSESGNGSYPQENLQFLAWVYLNRLSSGEWSDMGTAVWGTPPGSEGRGPAQSSVGVIWVQVREDWEFTDVPNLVEEAWSRRENPNWARVESAVMRVYDEWRLEGAGSENDPTNGGYWYASLTRIDEFYGGVTESEFDALVAEKSTNFQAYQEINPTFRWGYTDTQHQSGLYFAFFAGTEQCTYYLYCGQ